MTRNRDDLSTFQALLSGAVGAVLILALMCGLATLIAANKADASMRAAAMTKVTFTDEATRLADANTGRRG